MAVSASGWVRDVVVDNANATTFVGVLDPGDGSLIVAFLEASSSSAYTLKYMRSSNPEAADINNVAWSVYRTETLNLHGSESEKSAWFPQAHVVAPNGDWLRRVNQEDIPSSTPRAAVCQRLTGDKASAAWVPAGTGNNFTFGTNPGVVTVQVSRMRVLGDNRILAVGEYWPVPAGTRTTRQGQQPFLAVSSDNGATWTPVHTVQGGFADPQPLQGAKWMYPNEPDAVELPDGNILQVWRSGETLPWPGNVYTKTYTSSAYVGLKWTKNSSTSYTPGTPSVLSFSSAVDPIHPELFRHPTTNAIVFVSQSPEGYQYSSNFGTTWQSLPGTSPTNYYPRSVIGPGGLVYAFSHRGGDNVFGQTDNAIFMDRFAIAQVTAAGDTGWIAPVATSNDASIGTIAFTNPTTGGLSATGDQSGAPGLSGNKVSNYKRFDYGDPLTSDQVPQGIELALKIRQTVSGVVDHTVQILLDGVPAGVNKKVATAWPAAYPAAPYRITGGPTDMWGISPAALAAASKVEVRVAATSPSGTASTAIVQYAPLRITYGASAGKQLSGSTMADNTSVNAGTITGPVTGGGSTFYVDGANGQDIASRDGSQGQPWRTIPYAHTRAPQGVDSTVLVAPGTYRDINVTAANSGWVTYKPLLSGTVAWGPWTVSGSGVIAQGGELLAPTASSSVFINPFRVTGAGKRVKVLENYAQGDNCVNCIWIAPTSGSNYEVARNTLTTATWTSTGGPTGIVVQPIGTAPTNVWIHDNTLQNLYGFDAIQLTGGSTSFTNRYRNVWIYRNNMDGVFQGEALFAHSDGVQVIGYSGPLVENTPTEDWSGPLPTGDVGVVLDGNRISRGRGFLIMPVGQPGGGAPTVGEHESVIVRNNLFHDPRGNNVTSGQPSPDTPANDFQIKLAGNAPNFRVYNNTCTIYPLNGFTLNTGIIISGKTSAPGPNDRGSTNGVLKNNMAQAINTLNSGGTFVTFRSGGAGNNSYLGTATSSGSDYTAQPNDIQLASSAAWHALFKDPANGDFSLTPTAYAAHVGDAAWQPLVDAFGRRRSTTSPTRGAIENIPAGAIISGQRIVDNTFVFPGQVTGGATEKPIVASVTMNDGTQVFPGAKVGPGQVQSSPIVADGPFSDDTTVFAGALVFQEVAGDYTLRDVPAGKTVTVWTRSGSSASLNRSTPPGETVVLSRVAPASGVVSFSGLQTSTRYWAVYEGLDLDWKWVAFTTRSGPVDQATQQRAERWRDYRRFAQGGPKEDLPGLS